MGLRNLSGRPGRKRGKRGKCGKRRKGSEMREIMSIESKYGQETTLTNQRFHQEDEKEISAFPAFSFWL